MARLQTAVLCNAASVEQSGLVSMLGAFIDTVAGPELPIRQQLWLVARLFFSDTDVGVKHTVKVVVEALEPDDPAALDGRPLVEIVGELEAIGPAPDLDPRMTGGGPIVLPLPIEFPSTGVFHVALSLDGDLLWDAPLLVKLVG